MKTRNVIPPFLLLFLLLAPLSQRASAQYLDPGAGSVLFQVLVSGLLFVLFFFSKMKAVLRRRFGKGDISDSGSSTERPEGEVTRLPGRPPKLHD